MQLRDEMITVFGASGFIGRYVVRRLAKAGYRVRAATRRPHLANELRPMGVVGQIQLVQANVKDRASVERAVDGADGVINLVGILAEAGKQSFDALQHKGAGLIAECAKNAGIEKMVHISAIGADNGSQSKYARTKALGEDAVLKAMPGAVILRPSIVFGPEDEFFNKFADMARFAPALPLIGGGKTKFQPVYCDDVAECAVKALEMDETTFGGHRRGARRIGMRAAARVSNRRDMVDVQAQAERLRHQASPRLPGFMAGMRSISGGSLSLG